MATIQSVPIGEIEIRKGTQTRSLFHQEAVDEYSAIYSTSPDSLPPLVVFRIDGRFVLVDGFHRHIAAKGAGLSAINCEVRDGTIDDALAFALSANAKHGIRRSQEDKRKAVEMCIEAWPNISDRKAADMCCVSHHLVADVRTILGELKFNNPIPINPDRNTKTNTSTPNNSGRIPTAKDEHSQVVDVQSSKNCESSEMHLSNHALSHKAHKILDSTGTVIPSDAVPFWERRQEIQDLMSQVSAIKSKLTKAKAEADPLYGLIPNGVIVHLEQAYTHISEAKPYAVCTQCMGTPSFQPTGCAMCGNTGLIGKYKWDHVSRKEVKELRMKSNARRAHAAA